MDIYRQEEKLKILPRGLQYKREFRSYNHMPKSYTDMPKLFFLQEVSLDFEQERLNLLELCADSYGKFEYAHPF